MKSLALCALVLLSACVDFQKAFTDCVTEGRCSADVLGGDGEDCKAATDCGSGVCQNGHCKGEGGTVEADGECTQASVCASGLCNSGLCVGGGGTVPAG